MNASCDIRVGADRGSGLLGRGHRPQNRIRRELINSMPYGVITQGPRGVPTNMARLNSASFLKHPCIARCVAAPQGTPSQSHLSPTIQNCDQETSLCGTGSLARLTLEWGWTEGELGRGDGSAEGSYFRLIDLCITQLQEERTRKRLRARASRAR